MSKEAYTQGTLTLRRARKRLAERIWAMGVNSKVTRWSPQGTSTTTCGEAPPAGRARGPRGHLRKRKQGAGGRLTLGNTALRRIWRGNETGKPSRKEGQGSKRSAKPEAGEGGSDRKRVRIFQLPKKRARDLIVGH